MTETDLDHCYGVLAQALEQAGPDRATLLLSMVCLGMMGRMPSAQEVLPLIEHARRNLEKDLTPPT